MAQSGSSWGKKNYQFLGYYSIIVKYIKKLYHIKANGIKRGES